jgi:hypothetical protein
MPLAKKLHMAGFEIQETRPALFAARNWAQQMAASTDCVRFLSRRAWTSTPHQLIDSKTGQTPSAAGITVHTIRIRWEW